jgi:F420-dependent oxidoreductase-like protein
VAGRTVVANVCKGCTMRLCIFTEPQQGASYAEQARMARRTEEVGFDGFFRSDHYLHMGKGDGLPGPTDAWTTLAGLAIETSRIRLGTLVSSATFRLPGPLAIAVAQVDAMSNGRVELGLGAGWYEKEHAAYGIEFPPGRERFDRLEEQLAIINGLWTTPEGQHFNFAGEHYQLSDSPGLPKPLQRPRPPIIVGGHGPRRTPELAAKYATEFNIGFSPVDVVAEQFTRVRAAAERIGRTSPLTMSVAQVVCCGRSDAEIARRARAIGRSVDQLKEEGLCGTPEEIAAKINEFAKVGTERVFLQVLDIADVDHLDVISSVLTLL